MASRSVFLCLSLWVTWFSSSSEQSLGTPSGCLYNRLDVFPCTIVNPGSTDIPIANQYAIYSTRIRNRNGSPECIIRSRDDVVEPIDTLSGGVIRPTDTVGDSPSIYYLFSPGKELATPANYGNQQLIEHRIQCEDNHFAFFNLVFVDLEEPICIDPNFPDPRCVDYLRVSKGGTGPGNFGFVETCGTTIPPELTSQLDIGTIEVTLRTSDSDRRSGFSATVVCVNNQLLDGVDPDTMGRKRRSSFNARVRRQVEYVHRMRRSVPKTLEEARSLACSVDELNVPFNQGINYTDRVVNIVNMENMAVIRRLPSPISQLMVMDENGGQLYFVRDAPSVFPGPARLTRAGVCIFFEQVTTIPDLGGLSQEAVIPRGREANVTSMLLAAHTRLVLEQDSEEFSQDQLQPPTINETLQAEVPTPMENRWRRASSLRARRLVEELEPVQCNYTDEDLGLAILNRGTTNPVLLTVINVIINCTESDPEQEERIQGIIDTIPIDFEFDRLEYGVNESAGSVEVCLGVVTEGFLPRDIAVTLATQDGTAIAGSDYETENGILVFPAMSSSQQLCITITIIPDQQTEEMEVLQVIADSNDPNVNIPPPVNVFILNG